MSSLLPPGLSLLEYYRRAERARERIRRMDSESQSAAQKKQGVKLRGDINKNEYLAFYPA